MGLIKRGVKLGTALGITYLSVEQRLWSQLSHKEINDKLSAFKASQRKALTFVTEKSGYEINFVKQWIPTQESIDKQTITVKKLWNRSAKTGFQWLSRLHLKDLTTKLQKLINTSK